MTKAHDIIAEPPDTSGDVDHSPGKEIVIPHWVDRCEPYEGIEWATMQSLLSIELENARRLAIPRIGR